MEKNYIIRMDAESVKQHQAAMAVIDKDTCQGKRGPEDEKRHWQRRWTNMQRCFIRLLKSTSA